MLDGKAGELGGERSSMLLVGWGRASATRRKPLGRGCGSVGPGLARCRWERRGRSYWLACRIQLQLLRRKIAGTRATIRVNAVGVSLHMSRRRRERRHGPLWKSSPQMRRCHLHLSFHQKVVKRMRSISRTFRPASLPLSPRPNEKRNRRSKLRKLHVRLHHRDCESHRSMRSSRALRSDEMNGGPADGESKGRAQKRRVRLHRRRRKMLRWSGC